jgi:AraC-like DNA-binding protein
MTSVGPMTTDRRLRSAPKASALAGVTSELTWGPTFDRAIALAIEVGLRPEAFFAAIGKSPRLARGAAPRVPLDILARFLAWAAQASGDEAFGLKLGARFHPNDLGAYGYVLLNAGTLGEAMAFAQRFAAFQQQGEALAWSASPDGRVEFRYDPHGLEERLRRQDAECTLAIAHAVVRRLVRRPVRPVEVRVRHDCHGPVLEEHFGCPVIQGGPDCALVYEAPLLGLPIHGADAKLLPILVDYVERELEGLPPLGDDLARIRWAIRRSLGGARLSLARVARQSRLGERTLQRRLAKHGLTFSDLVDVVRRDVHAELCRSGDRSRRETAELLGFSDASALAKATRRWKRAAPAERTKTAMSD